MKDGLTSPWMQSLILDFASTDGAGARMVQARFPQENPDRTYSSYTCRWLRRKPHTSSAQAVQTYLQACFSDPGAVGRLFAAWKYRCSRLAVQVPSAPFIARRFAREAPTLCHINTRTGKRVLGNGFERSLARGLCDPRPRTSHGLMQLNTVSSNHFVALEVPLHSSLLTGHLDCLLCDEENDMLYAIEIKSYPSDHTDPWAGTPRQRLFTNLVQALGYCELLALNTGLSAVAAGVLHRHGLILLDATHWLRSGGALLGAVEKHALGALARHRTWQPCPSGPEERSSDPSP